jgi:hypothetical protein
MRRPRELVHFLDADTREPLCGGTGTVAARAAVNGTEVCADCARKIADEVGRVLSQPMRTPQVTR